MVKTTIDDGTQTTVLQTVGATTTAIITDTENPETITAKYTISKDGTATYSISGNTYLGDHQHIIKLMYDYCHCVGRFDTSNTSNMNDLFKDYQ
jgi:hypothetical protein